MASSKDKDMTSDDATSDIDKKNIGRRTMLGRMWAAGGALIAAAGGWTTWDLLQPLPTTGFGGKVRSVAADAVPEGAVIEVPAARSFLTAVNGEVIAISEKCPHLGCRTPYCESSGRFECPCHGSVFSRAGDYIAGPAPRGMDRYALAEEDGLLIVDTGERIDGAAPGSKEVDEPSRGPACAGETH